METETLIRQGNVIEHGDEYITEFLGEAGCADVERRTVLFEEIAKDFSTQVGKVCFASYLSFDRNIP